MQAEDFYSLNEEVAAAAAAATAAGAGLGAREGEATSDLASYSLPNSAALANGVLPPPAGGRRTGKRGGKAKLTLFG